MQSLPEVVVAGELFLDLIMSGLNARPKSGKEVFARDFHREIGGGAAITACGLAKLGSATVVLGVVGQEDGEWVVSRLRQKGVGVDWIEFDAAEPTGITVAASTPRDRTFITYSGANRGFSRLLMRAARAKRVQGARHIHLAYAPEIDTAAEMIALLQGNGCTISLDVGWHEDWLGDKRVAEILRGVDIFFPNEFEACCMTGEEDPIQMLRAFAAMGLRRVAVKLGSRGSAALWEGNTVSASAHPVTPADTTGAGDCFNAGFLSAWLGGRSPQVCLQSANICAALSTEVFGGIDGFPSPDRLQSELGKEQVCEK